MVNKFTEKARHEVIENLLSAQHKTAEVTNIRAIGDKKDWQTLINTIKVARIKAPMAPSSRERSIVITKLEEALMWAEHGRDAAYAVLDGEPNE